MLFLLLPLWLIPASEWSCPLFLHFGLYRVLGDCGNLDEEQQATGQPRQNEVILNLEATKVWKFTIFSSAWGDTVHNLLEL